MHRLGGTSLEALLERLENNKIDKHADIATVIGIAVDRNADWGQLTFLELKLLIEPA